MLCFSHRYAYVKNNINLHYFNSGPTQKVTTCYFQEAAFLFWNQFWCFHILIKGFLILRHHQAAGKNKVIAKNTLLSDINILIKSSASDGTQFFAYRRSLRCEKNFDNWKPFKIDEKFFLFHLKSSFQSEDVLVFVVTFWSCRKNGSIRKIRLISNPMTSQPG